jgi:hypothetical protein
MFRRISFVFIIPALVLIVQVAKGQVLPPQLPYIAGATDRGISVLSWYCQYDGIKTIAVQRSRDSIHNFMTVGYVKNLKKGPQAFIDGHPMPGNNWYQLYIVFNSDLTWMSTRFKIFVDSSAILKKGVLPPNDSLQKFAARIKVDSSVTVVRQKNIVTTMETTKPKTYSRDSAVSQIVSPMGFAEPPPPVPERPKLSVSIPDPEEISAYSYLKSQYVFTNPFTGHVNVEISDVKQHHYSVRFFNAKNKEVLDIPNVTEKQVIIDKRNFQGKGLYKFELRQDRQQLETGYITIY